MAFKEISQQRILCPTNKVLEGARANEDPVGVSASSSVQPIKPDFFNVCI